MRQPSGSKNDARASKGMLYTGQLLLPPSAEVREALVGFNVGDTTTPGLNQRQRTLLLGQCINLNIISWVISQTPPGGERDITCPSMSPDHPDVSTGFTCSKPLPNLKELPSLLPAHATYAERDNCPKGPAHATPMATTLYPGKLDIHGRIRHERPTPPRGHGRSHPLTYHNLHRCNGERGNPHYHADRTRCYTHSSRQNCLPPLGWHLYGLPVQPPSHPPPPLQPWAFSPPRYHHSTLILRSISDLLRSRQTQGFTAALYKLRAHTSIKGNNVADEAAKLAVTFFETLPPGQILRVDVGAIAPPLGLVYYIPHNPSPNARLGPPTSHPPATVGDNPRGTNPRLYYALIPVTE
jgi:hypothetical protein